MKSPLHSRLQELKQVNMGVFQLGTKLSAELWSLNSPEPTQD